jgi:ABC-type transport system involved in cytochrome c biogenesis permease subunit
MLAISGKQTWVDANERRQPAVKWFLDVMATPKVGAEHRVVRIENLEVQELLGLPRREGFRYSLNELFERFDKFLAEAEKASKVSANQQSVYQRKLLELKRKVDVIHVLLNSFAEPPIQGEGEKLAQSMIAQMQRQKALKEQHPPLAVPPVEKDESWETYSSGWLWNLVKEMVTKQPKNPFAEGWQRIFAAYESRDADAFNAEVARLHRLYREQTPSEVNLARVDFEAYFNRVQPTTMAIGLYVTAFVIAALGWLCLAFHWRAGLRLAGRTAFCLTAFTLIVHTLALVARMYISGRPPVTNLYSSSVFIGWGCVVLGLLLEAVFRVGLGNVVATVAGYTTLLIAWRLESDGSDTFSVMQAVLDTQFWLATHVTCITLGYATTYLAGLFGLMYILLGTATPWLTPQLARDLTRMNYGTLCFSIFFSFVGTVLGGLWADDSWGRFWGWDPKENGALMIVLWNALILHARWGGMIKERGLAALAVAGNIVVSWSWFGVNALSVGLHAYGFDQRIFATFCTLTLVHLPIIALGLVPREKWWSWKLQQG